MERECHGPRLSVQLTPMPSRFTSPINQHWSDKLVGPDALLIGSATVSLPHSTWVVQLSVDDSIDIYISHHPLCLRSTRSTMPCRDRLQDNQWNVTWPEHGHISQLTDMQTFLLTFTETTRFTPNSLCHRCHWKREIGQRILLTFLIRDTCTAL